MTCQFKEQTGAYHFECERPAEHQCECCKESRCFCSDHGSVGGDVVQEGYADTYRPNACWKCGGFNADE